MGCELVRGLIMPKRVDYEEGFRFNIPETRLTYKRYTRNNNHNQRMAMFKCDCGNEKELVITLVKRGATKSCGCYRNENNKATWTTHGESRTPTHNTWYGMIRRCTDKEYSHFSYYGGRGIKVCERWLGDDGFKNFKLDMGERPDGKTLDRIDGNGDYTPDNCRWVDRCNQSYNQRIQINNTTGFTGVRYSHTRKNGDKVYQAYLVINRKSISILYTTDFEEACDARAQAELDHYGYSPKCRETVPYQDE